MSETSVLKNFNKEKHFFKDPYPHIHIKQCLDKLVFERLYENFPVQLIKENFQLLEGHTFRALADDILNKKTIKVHAIWQEFFEYHTSQEFYDLVMNIFEPYMDRKYKFTVGVRGATTTKDRNLTMTTDTQFVVHQPHKTTTRTTHIDNPLEIYAGLLYFKQRGDTSQGGDFLIHTSPEVSAVRQELGREIPNDVEHRVQKTITYEANTFVMFLNSNKSVHGVTPRENAMVDRLSINIIGELIRGQQAPFTLQKV